MSHFGGVHAGREVGGQTPGRRQLSWRPELERLRKFGSLGRKIGGSGYMAWFWSASKARSAPRPLANLLQCIIRLTTRTLKATDSVGEGTASHRRGSEGHEARDGNVLSKELPHAM
jgi:hypothetical protein